MSMEYITPRAEIIEFDTEDVMIESNGLLKQTTLFKNNVILIDESDLELDE